ncbi:hypothetical protein, conserved [Babesia ovata]|uniref:Uncharacterized protein n=1 Tax=Babesia ovata TaxID=189622 RepID=A0A2H6KAA4_9APIC|nr:uncharacterized protein BOVATA_014080 [Babesia ovata]GBE59915.1 hypothetical protein, conserved [Babesia ovata]
MVYNSLTEVPRNLKECIDWLIALKGDDAENNLKAMGKALYGLLADKLVGFTEVPALEKVKHVSEVFLRRQGIRDQPFVKELLQRFNKPMDKSPKKIGNVIKGVEESDYKNVVKARGTKPEAIAKNLGKVVDAYEKFLDDIKAPDQYESAYSSEATWEASCSKEPEACVVILVGIAPMLYASVRPLKDVGKFATVYAVDPMEENRVGSVLEAVGYKEPECRAGTSGSDVLKVSRGVDKDVLDIIYDFAAFWAFY